MIARIEGKLIELDEDSALLAVERLAYEVYLPGYCVNALSAKIGEEIVLWTMEYYEGTPGKGNLIPRMVGFLNPAEREFFRKFTSVKGIGVKKGVKALAIPIARIAAAIEGGDEKTLGSLPSIGKRMAQQIIAELKGKLEVFAAGAEVRVVSGGEEFRPFQTETMEILIAWGEKRDEVMAMIERTCKKHPDVRTAEELVPLVYRMKQGMEV